MAGIRTITLEEPGRFTFGQTDAPDAPDAGEALARVRRVGICGTDLHAYRGRQPFFSYPRILGHELGVEIVALGPETDGSGLRVGDRCAVEPYLNCGECIACRRGKTNCCVRLSVLGVHTDGGMRELIRVPVSKLHKSETLSLDQLALVETLGIGAHAVSRAQIEPGENALVIGAGPIGLATMQFALAAGANVIALDVNESRLDFCQTQLGVAHTVLAAPAVSAPKLATGTVASEPVQDAALNAVSRHTNDDLPTVVFDATGNAASMMNSFRFVAHGGRLVFVGLFLGDVTFYDPDFHRREMTLLATRNATGADFQHIIALLESGKVDTTPWITHRANCDELIAHFPTWLEPESRVIKAIVSF